MMKPLMLTLCVAGAFAFQQAVQDAAKTYSKGATVRGYAKEVENGRALYEVELSVNGLTRDLTFDAQGKVVADEQQIALSDVPSAARAVIQKAATGGKLTLVEKVIEGSSTAYEGHITKGGKATEIKVDANGKPVK